MTLHVPSRQKLGPINRRKQKTVVVFEPGLWLRTSFPHLPLRSLELHHFFEELLELTRTALVVVDWGDSRMNIE
ncbi:MAG TPA: hypothetical protein VG963_28505, partial [Polyangiaceae bacterium]|nr:hypothetical protein [Polyangiaceae bacterium]